jgi:hypothetical protein
MKRRVGLIGIFSSAAVVGAAFVLWSLAANGEFGFPLDDAWIHQVYARNLGTRFEFSFFPGQPSAGSTSPLWSALVAIGYAGGLDYRVWTILLGILLLGATGWQGAALAQRLTDARPVAGLAAALLIVSEWHMVWAAASGMEILLFVFLSLLLVRWWWEGKRAWMLGLVAGLLTLTRPEGVALAGLVGAGLAVTPRGDKGPGSKATEAAIYVAALGLTLAPYLAFNMAMTGGPLPNTFYAKAAEYSELTSGGNPVARWLGLYRQPLTGAQLLLVPGFFYAVFCLAQKRDWRRVMPLAWVAVLPALYAVRLPVEYQYGRYVMPIIPFLILYGVAGTAELMERLPGRVLKRAAAASTGAVALTFLALGADQYAQSVAVINCEMVAMARWTAAKVEDGELLAAHDIGAQGYFDPRPVLDMAGLVSPEVIPFMRDEANLLAWMQARGARYGVFFPTWYPTLAANRELKRVHATDCGITRELGEENLTLYEIRPEAAGARR